MNRPILFSTEMVRAILAGRKTQTRRPLTQQPLDVLPANLPNCWVALMIRDPEIGNKGVMFRSRYGIPGDQLWVKETWAKAPNGFVYRADYQNGHGDEVVDLRTGRTVPLIWKSSRFMAKDASRVMLEIMRVQVERVRDISEADAIAEGTTPSIVGDDLDHLRFRAGYQTLWDSLNAKRGFGWDTNPWVWVIEFKKVAP
jgi:hypothetical protein